MKVLRNDVGDWTGPRMERELGGRGPDAAEPARGERTAKFRGWRPATSGRRALVAAVAAIALIGSPPAEARPDEGAAEQGVVVPVSKTPSMRVIPLDDALDREFRPLYDERPGGPHLLVLEGDPRSGPSLTLFRYGRDYTGSGTLHFHTHDYHLWLIEGELKHWDETGDQETAPILRPGSHVYQPANLPHAANCLSARCTAYVVFGGPIETGFPDPR
ncbi:MAG: hypothetical protein AAGF23_07545 [Acidobacteriota bacterium]